MKQCSTCKYYTPRQYSYHSSTTKSIGFETSNIGSCSNTESTTPFAVNEHFGCNYYMPKLKRI